MHGTVAKTDRVHQCVAPYLQAYCRSGSVWQCISCTEGCIPDSATVYKHRELAFSPEPSVTEGVHRDLILLVNKLYTFET